MGQGGSKKGKGNHNGNGLGNGLNASRKSSDMSNHDEEAELQESLRAYDYCEQLIRNVMEGEKDRGAGLGQLRLLPDECILRVISFLPMQDICSLQRVSKTLFTLGRDDSLWKHIYRDRGVKSLFGPNALDDSRLPQMAENWHKHKRKKKRCHGKWHKICLKNMLLLPDGEPVILNEQILGCPLDWVIELFGQSDEVIAISRGNAYYFFHAVGLSMCCEDSKITAVLKLAPLDTCRAYEKIVPLPF